MLLLTGPGVARSVSRRMRSLRSSWIFCCSSAMRTLEEELCWLVVLAGVSERRLISEYCGEPVSITAGGRCTE